jgi:hypothetical protein
VISSWFQIANGSPDPPKTAFSYLRQLEIKDTTDTPQTAFSYLRQPEIKDTTDPPKTPLDI